MVICTGLVLLGSSIPGAALPEVTTALARATLVVMLVHIAVIDQIDGFEHRSFGELLVVLAASWGTGLFLVALPRASWLTGQRPRRTARAEISGRIPQPVKAFAE